VIWVAIFSTAKSTAHADVPEQSKTADTTPNVLDFMAHSQITKPGYFTLELKSP
jgi:hypothetical protein